MTTACRSSRPRSLGQLAQDFTTFLRQLTQGRGYFTFEFVRYETLPQMLENKVIEQAKALGNFADED